MPIIPPVGHMQSPPSLLIFAFFTFSPLTSLELPTEETKTLFECAQNALEKKDYIQAIEKYTSLLHLTRERKKPKEAEFSVIYNLCLCLKELKQTSEAKVLLEDLVKMDLPIELYLKAVHLRAELAYNRDEPKDAYEILRETEKNISADLWTKELLDSYHLLQAEVNAYYEALLGRAENLFESSLYGEAFILFQELIDAITEGEYLFFLTSLKEKEECLNYLKYRLKQSQYLEEHSKILIANHEELPTPLSHEESYLLALAYKKEKQYDRAVELLQTLIQETNLPKDLRQSADWGLAVCLYEHGEYTQAKKKFTKLAETEDPKSKEGKRALLFIARIDLHEKNYIGAKETLNKISITSKESDILFAEASYVKAHTLFLLEDFEGAKKSYLEALFCKHLAPDCLYGLGCCYFKLAEAEVHPEKNLNEAKAVLEKFIEITAAEKGCLALGLCLLLEGKIKKSEIFFEKAEALYLSFPFSKNGEYEANLLLAQAASSFPMKNKFYRFLTQEANATLPLYKEAWLRRGESEFKEGKELLQEGRVQEAQKCFMRASLSFEKCYYLERETSKPRAAIALKNQALAFLEQGTSDAKQAALVIIESFLHENADLRKELPCKEEISYLHGTILANLSLENENPALLEQAIASLQQAVLDTAGCDLAKSSLYTLGTLLYKKGYFEEAASYFKKIVDCDPHSPLVSEALYWQSRSLEKAGYDFATFGEIRKRIAEQFPSSVFADEAYFTNRPMVEYLEGQPNAILHLAQMQEKFPKSPYLITVNYLLGLHKRKESSGAKISAFLEAITYFEKAGSLFKETHEQGILTEENLEYFVPVYYHAIIELAKTHKMISELSKGAKAQVFLEYAMTHYQALLQDFSHGSPSLASYLYRKHAFPPVLEEATLGLAEVMMLSGDDAQAEEHLSTMLKKYEKLKITRGYYLAKTYICLGEIAMRKKNYREALTRFAESEEADKGRVLSNDARLTLWIQESKCHMALGDTDGAMRLLSKVINEDVVSSLRLKAMYLRAEIYESQGRGELAMKQLEATAKKGGEWGLKAKEKLENDYHIY